MDRRLALLVGISCGALLAGCAGPGARIERHRAEFERFDPATRQAIERGEVRPGFTPDMVYLALGRPARETTSADGDQVWRYHYEPPTAANETIRDGFRKRVVYDPVKRTNDVVVEPIDTKAFPNLVPHTLEVTFRAGRVVSLRRRND